MPDNQDADRPESEQAQLTPSPSRRRTTSSDRLLDQAVRILGVSSLAAALQLSEEDVRTVARREQPMTLAQQRVLALAVLAVTEHQGLRRQAASLLAQVQAAEDYHAGVTVRCASPPRIMGWKT